MVLKMAHAHVCRLSSFGKGGQDQVAGASHGGAGEHREWVCGGAQGAQPRQGDLCCGGGVDVIANPDTKRHVFKCGQLPVSAENGSETAVAQITADI